MFGHLPSLRALQAFEAAARNASFSRAARELYVTHGAISRQIRQLESALGVRLLTRGAKGAALTAEGLSLYARVREGFDCLASGVREIRQTVEPERLAVSLSVSLAAKWLIPRLERFRVRHPAASIWVDAEDRIVDLAAAGIDVGLRYGEGNWPACHAELVMPEELIVVGAPGRRLDPGVPRLHDGFRDGWPDWADRAGMSLADEQDRALHITNTALLIEMAAAGQGIALVRRSLAQDDLRAGRLAQLSPVTVPLPFALYFVCRREALAKPLVAAFRAWIFEEAALA